MLRFLGSQPNGLTEWSCSLCFGYFDFLERDSDAEPKFDQPKYCPLCGSAGPVEVIPVEGVRPVPPKGEKESL